MGADSSAKSDISDWEIRDGLPQPTDQFIQQYLQGREALMEQEKAQRSDYAFRQSLNPLAAEACAIVSRIRQEEYLTVWKNRQGSGPLSENEVQSFPGMMFTLARKKIETTKTWEIVRRMPKGALLHAHLDGMIDVEWLIDQMLATTGMAIMADQSLSSVEARANVSATFQYSENVFADANSIWNENYQPNQLVSAKIAATSFPEGGLDGFKTWLRNRCTITQQESLEYHDGVDSIWEKFAHCFPVLNSILAYEPIFRAAIQRLLLELVDDGLRWVEFRMAFVFQYRREGCEEPEKGYEEFFRVFNEEVEKFKAMEKTESLWGCRFIWTTLRAFGKKDIVDSMKQCISVKQSYPDLIAGFDLVGQEDMGRSLADLTPEFFWFRKRCIETGVEIPFFFHAGECLGDGDDADHNLFDAVLLGTRRIGHGFSLYKHPLLVEMVKQKNILIESCPISNEILRLTNSVKAHPLPALLSRGVVVCLSNDDPAVLGHGRNGLTHDFWQVLQGWENLGLEGLGSLAENSVRYAAYHPDQTAKDWNKDTKDGVFGNGVRASRLREWNSQWNKFCEWVVMEFAADYGSDKE